MLLVEEKAVRKRHKHTVVEVSNAVRDNKGLPVRIKVRLKFTELLLKPSSPENGAIVGVFDCRETGKPMLVAQLPERRCAEAEFEAV